MKQNRILSFLIAGLMMFTFFGHFPNKMLLTANAATYNPSKAIAYAEKYWNNYNENYSDYNEIGGDCANFVSQCLVAGGLSMTDGWYWNDYYDRSGSWSYCPSMYNYFKDKGYEIIEKPSASDIKEGNPILYAWDGVTWGHAAICVGKDSKGVPVVAAHNDDYWGSDWKMGAPKVCTIIIPSNATNSVTINYHTNGGTIGNDEYYAKDGKIYIAKTDALAKDKWDEGKGDSTGLYNGSTFKLSKKGFTFLGWSTSKNNVKRIFNDRDTSLIANDIYPDVATKSGTVTLYAVWGGKEMKESEGAGQKIPDGNYWIVNALNSRYAVDILGDNYDTKNGTNLAMHMWNDHNFGKYDVFTVKYLNNGYYSITQRTTNMCVDVSDGSLLPGTNVQMWKNNGTSSQQWSIKESENGYTIQSRVNGFFLDVQNGSTENANLQVYPGNNSKSQLFSFIPYNSGQPVKDGVYRIGTVNGKGAYIDAAGEPDEYKNKTNLQIWDAGADNYFKFEYSGNGFYKIYDNESGLAVDVDNSSQRNYLTRDANVQLYESKDTPGQYWAIKSDGEGYYYLISKLNGYYLDLNKGITTNGNNIHMWSATNGKTQKWSLVTNKKLVVTPPSKNTYKVGENIDLSGMTVKMVFSDGYEWDVTKYVKVDCDLSTSGVKNATVTYKNGGFTNKTTFKINVKDEKVKGDINADGTLNVADVVLLQKWLLGVPDATLVDWKAADLCEDERLDVFDLCLMKRELVKVS